MSLDEMRSHSGLSADEQNKINIFVEFLTNDPRIESIYENDKFILRIEFDSLNNGKTGRIFKNRKIDYAFEDFISIELDEEFYQEFYLKHLYNPKMRNYDLRILYYLNKNPEDQYNVKIVRPTYYEFSKYPFCAYYEYTDKKRSHIRSACVSQGIFRRDGETWCPIHFNTSN